MPSQYPVLNDKPIDQWRVIELREELRRRNLVTKGLKEELVKRLDEAIQKDAEAINLGELINGDEANLNSQNNTSEEDPSLERADKLTSLEEDNNTDKDASMVNNSHIVFDVIPGNEVHIGDAIEVTALVEKDEKATIVTDLEGSAPENQNLTALSGMQVEDAKPQKFEVLNSSILVIDEKASSSDLEESALVNQNIIDHSDTQGEDGEPVEMFEELKPPIVGTDEKVATICDSKGSSPFNQNATVQSSMQGEDAGPEEKFEESKSLIVESAVIHSGQSNQVSVISQDLEFQVKYKSNSTDSVSINEKNIIMDNLTADHFPLELVAAKQEVVQPSSNIYPTGDAHSCMVVDEQEAAKNHATDEQEDLKNQVFVGQEVAQNLLSDKQETNISYAPNEHYIVQIQVPCQQGRDEEHASFNDADMQNVSILDPPKKEDCVELGSPEKLNLDRSSGDESMEEDILDIKHIEADIKFEEPATKIEAITLDIDIVERTEDDMSKSSFEMKDIAVEDIKPAFLTEKRKLEEAELVVNNGPPKRHRRWNPDTIKVPEQQIPHVNISTMPKNNLQPTVCHAFSRSNSTIIVESPKERIVPTPKKPATTSLRIDNFLRPFTLKAVQELLEKTGHVCDFWMDHIKTHCYVTFSSVEGATATRNAVYNLQWPPNGGRLLAADFVDPQEVKLRLEAPPPSLAPIGSDPATPKAPPSKQKTQAPQTTHQQNLRLQLPLPPPPSPVPQPLQPISLSNPPTAREHLPPPSKKPEPPPSKKPEPAPPKKPESPVMTLDDLFKKTSATPRIYYLPLTEEQARAKVTAQSKRTKV